MNKKGNIEIIQGPFIEDTLEENIFYLNEFSALERSRDKFSAVFKINHERYEVLRTLDASGRGSKLKEIFKKHKEDESGRVVNVGYSNSNNIHNSGLGISFYKVHWEKFYEMGMPKKIKIKTRVINEFEPLLPDCIKTVI